jgi:hypothetical protein
MKSKATKDAVQAELAKTIGEQIGEHVTEIGAKSAEHVVEIWQNFRSAHAKVLDLALRNDNFKSFLDTVKPDSLARLDEVTSLILAAEGEAGILRRLDDGTLDQAVKWMPAAAMDIAREERSIDVGLKWSALAGNNLPKVIEFEIHRRSSPDAFSKATLERLLSLDDRIAIMRLASVSREARDTLFELETRDLKSLARSLTEDEITTLARYLTGLEKVPRERILRTVAAQPTKIQVLAASHVREAVIASPDQAAAVDMMLRSGGSLTPQVIIDDVRLAWEGRVSPVLVWQQHTLAVCLAGLVLVLILLILRRLLLPPRRTPPQPASS